MFVVFITFSAVLVLTGALPFSSRLGPNLSSATIKTPAYVTRSTTLSSTMTTKPVNLTRSTTQTSTMITTPVNLTTPQTMASEESGPDAFPIAGVAIGVLFPFAGVIGLVVHFCF
ncbi:uncharacterized protein LOC131951215 [Physella acuta]|uniref:uncharacterized protein LOC131951215 n=1 Tax=Physella acuta TaxID=109671 RepID=UPI0027DDBE36|nr:uncharacterized protein LOC131951215 [Physella acuta]